MQQTTLPHGGKLLLVALSAVALSLAFTPAITPAVEPAIEPAIEPAYGSSNWWRWWGTNREALLHHWGQKTPGRTFVGWGDAVVSRGRHAIPPPMSPERMRRLVPDLVKVLEKTDETNLRMRLSYAVGRIADGEATTAARLAMEKLLSDSSQDVRSTMTMALGILGDRAAQKTLLALLRDDDKGHIAVRQSRVSDGVRAHAALALGLLGAEDVVEDLVAVLERDDPGEWPIQANAILALGLVREDPQGEVLRILLDVLENPPRDDRSALQVPIALGKLGNHAAVKPLTAVLLDDKGERTRRQSAAIALGQLATCYDEAAVNALIDLIAEAAEDNLRHFALMSIAQIGGRTPRSPQAWEHTPIEERLLAEIRKPSHKDHGVWAALALAVYAIEHRHLVPVAIQEIIPLYESEGDPDEKCGFAVALALLEAEEYGDVLFEDLEDLTEDFFRGTVALSLGMLGHEDAREFMTDRMLDKSTTSGQRISLNRALALLGGRITTLAILGEWKTGGDARRRESLAAGLARLRDPWAIDRMLAMVIDDGATAPRAEAATSLGLLADKHLLRFHEALIANTHPDAGVPARLSFASY